MNGASYREGHEGRRARASGAALSAFAAAAPLLALLAYFAAGERGLILASGVLSAAVLTIALAGLGWSRAPRRDAETGLPDRSEAVALLSELTASGAISGRRTAALAIGFDGSDDLEDDGCRSQVLREAARRIAGIVRRDDLVFRLDGAALGVVVSNLRRADLQMVLQIAARLQRELSAPFDPDEAAVTPTVSVGFCLPHRAPSRDGAAMLAGAERALREAREETGGAIRAYAGALQARDESDAATARAASEALSRDEIRPWFQPQLSAETGELMGLAVLPRWERPGGIAAPAEDLLPLLAKQGKSGKLAQALLSRALEALADWDASGLRIPRLSMSVTMAQLRHPGFVDRVRWELDRFEIAPSRLVLDLADPIAGGGPDDLALRNLDTLARLGCGVGLADFGPRFAALAEPRRWRSGRLVLARALSAGIDRDAGLRRTVRALVGLAGGLGLSTVAEGIETPAEAEALAALGCEDLQGPALAPPLPGRAVADWLAGRPARGSGARPGADPGSALPDPKTA